jgi:hypothetical protein
MTYGNADQTYQDRQGVGVNIAEEMFEQWCERNGWNCTRLGFDEKFANVGAFYNLNPILRNIPDYVIQRDERTFVVNVKGTANIKEKERLLLPQLIEAYSTQKAPLIYMFSIRNQRMKFAEAEHIIELYDIESDKKWNDGVVYRTINLMCVR